MRAKQLSPEAAETLYSLGTMKAKQGKTDKALELLREAVDHGMLPREPLHSAKTRN
jgi:pentatricopeptide repeat protein